MRIRRVGLLLVLCSLGWVTPALAWNATGHSLVTQIAHDNLSAAERHAFIVLLKQHPRYKTDFLGGMPPAIANGTIADQTQWLFRQAGPWPDTPRRYRWWLRYRFHAPQWHFINYPIGDFGAAVEPEDAIPKRGGWRRLPRKMNAVQAVRTHVAIMQDPRRSASDRALSLTWLCHIVGDLHQPLHTTSLFTAKRFRDGDRGGNEIPIEGQGSLSNLHELWDSLAGRGFSDRMQQSRAKQLAVRFPPSVLVAPDATDPKVWVRESVFLSRNIAYGTTIPNHIMLHDVEGTTLAPARITEDYMGVARSVAEPRIALAGYRLAAVLSNVLASDTESH